MADFGLFIGWKDPARGRERQAVQVFNEAVALYSSLQERGKIESWDAVFLEPHGGDLNGFFLLRGDRDKLAAVRWSDEFLGMTMRASITVDGFGVVGAEMGARIAQQMEHYQRSVGELA